MPLSAHSARLFLAAFWLAGGVSRAASQPELVDVFTQDVTRFTRLLTSPIPERRVEGIQGLSHLKYRAAEEALMKLLGDSSPAVHREASLALGRLGTGKSVPHLIRLLDNPSWELREQAHLALCRMTAKDLGAGARKEWQSWWDAGSAAGRERELLATLGRVVASRSNAPPTRREGLRALRALAGSSTEAAVVELLTKPQTPPLSSEERVFAAEILELIGGASAVQCLAWQGTDAAAWALGRIGGAKAEAALLVFPKTLPVLLNLDRLNSTNAGPFIPHLVNSFGLVTYRGQPDDLDQEQAQPIQRVAANLILRSGAAPKLIELTLRELEKTMQPPLPAGGVEATPADWAPMFQAMREELKPGFVRGDGLTTSQPLVAVYHVASDAALAKRLIPLLRHPAFVPRVYVAMLLGKLHATEAAPAILTLLREGYPFSDATALASGKHFDQSQTVRWRGFLCMALGRMGGEEARLALEGLASDPQGFRDIRYSAVIGLGFIGCPKSVPVLRRVAEQDIIWMVRDTARQTAEQIELISKEGE